MNKLAIIGRNISYSLSPLIWSYIGRILETALDYRILDLSSADDIAGNIGRLDAFNVTIPYKRDIITHLDEMDPGVTMTGACNFVHRTSGGLKGYNTDISGFRQALAEHIPDSTEYHIVLIGKGGAAAAVVPSLVELGISDIELLTRPDGKAGDEFIRQFDKYLNISAFDKRPSNKCLWINSTPVHPGEFEKKLPLQAGDILYHLSYRIPEQEINGIKEFNGADMLLKQALEAVAILWPDKRISSREINSLKMLLAKNIAERETI